MEVFCPELREATALARLAQLSAARAVGPPSDVLDDVACQSLAFAFDCLRVDRLCGTYAKHNLYTVDKISGQDKKNGDCAQVL